MVQDPAANFFTDRVITPNCEKFCIGHIKNGHGPSPNLDRNIMKKFIAQFLTFLTYSATKKYVYWIMGGTKYLIWRYLGNFINLMAPPAIWPHCYGTSA